MFNVFLFCLKFVVQIVEMLKKKNVLELFFVSFMWVNFRIST